jgi:hypothetical protein
MCTKNLPYSNLVLVFVLISTMALKSQDSLLKPKVRLFDIQFGLGMGFQSPPKITKSNVGDYTSHKDYASEDFMADYSDTVGGRFFFGNRHYIGDPELGFNFLFQIHNTPSKLLTRFKPRVSINYYHSSLFRYSLGYEKLTRIDTFYYVDPSYPPLIEKQYEIGNIQYTYSSNNFCLALGSNFDIIQRGKIIIYAGFLYGLSVGDVRFRVQKLDANSKVDEEFREHISFTSRFIFPVGIMLRAKAYSRRNINVFGELKPGYYLLRIKSGAKAQGSVISVNFGLRLSLHPHK